MAKKKKKRVPIGRMIGDKVFGLSTPDRHSNASTKPTEFNHLKPTKASPKLLGTRPTLIIMDEI